MENLKAIRLARHVTQTRLSVELGVAQETISAYESGRTLPSAETLCKMADFFEVSTDYLLDRTKVPTFVSDKLREDEAELLSHYQRLSAQQRAKALGILCGMDQA